MRATRGETLAAYLLIAPFVVSFVVFFLLPSLYSVVLSLYDYNGYADAVFVGLDNYAALLRYPLAWTALKNTLFYWLVPTAPLLGGAFLRAVAVQSKLMRWGRVFKPLMFLPQVMAPVAAALVWRVVFSTDSGVINRVIGRPIGWITDPALMKLSVSVLLTWRGIGWVFIIFLAGLTRIPAELYEAASVDGAGPWHKLWYVTVPNMKPIFLFTAIVHTISSLRLYAEPNLLVTARQSAESVPPEAAPLMNVLITNVGNGAFGLAAALGWMLFLLIGVFSIAQFRLFREEKT